MERKPLSTKTERFVMQVIDQVSPEFDVENINTQEEVARRVREEESEQVLTELFWSAYEKARDAWMERRHK